MASPFLDSGILLGFQFVYEWKQKAREAGREIGVYTSLGEREMGSWNWGCRGLEQMSRGFLKPTGVRVMAQCWGLRSQNKPTSPFPKRKKKAKI